jgi:hypothetical protein
MSEPLHNSAILPASQLPRSGSIAEIAVVVSFLALGLAHSQPNTLGKAACCEASQWFHIWHPA